MVIYKTAKEPYIIMISIPVTIYDIQSITDDKPPDTLQKLVTKMAIYALYS